MVYWNKLRTPWASKHCPHRVGTNTEEIRLVSWLILVNKLADWLIDWLIGWLIDWLNGWSIDWLTDWSMSISTIYKKKTWWRDQMEIFSPLLAFCAGNPSVTEFTGHRWIPLTKARDAERWCFFFICAWTNSGANNGDTGDLRRHRAH